MADPFSLAAGSFAVFGVVDVVLRASVECRDFLSAIRGAPGEIERLQTHIEENRALVEAFKKHMHGLKNNAAVATASNMGEAIKLFRSSVNILNRELSALQRLEAKYKKRSTLWNSIKFHLDERKVAKCMRNLETAKSALGAALALVNGVSSAIHHEAVEKTINTIAQATQQLGKLDLIQKDLRETSRYNGTEHAKTRAKIAEGNQSIIDTIASKFASTRINVCARNTHVQEIYFFSQSPDIPLDLLVLMKSHVQEVGVLAITESLDIGWLQDAFEALTASALQEAAAVCPGSTATSLNQWVRSPRPVTIDTDRVICEHLPQHVLDTEIHPKTSSQSEESSISIRCHPRFRIFRHKSPVGQLYLQVPQFFEGMKAAQGIREARLVFIPSLGVCTASLAIRFVESIVSRREPRLYAQLNTFRLIQCDSPHWDIISSGTMMQIDDAIRSGVITPYDQLSLGIGWMICFFIAGSYFRLEVLQYFESQGILLSGIDGGYSVLCGLWYSVQGADFGAFSESSLSQILDFIEKNATGCLSYRTTDLLHPYCWRPKKQVTDRRARMIRTLLRFLKQGDYDFEARNKEGRTPLLTHILARGGASLVIARTLLELGANPHAVDREGRNAIQLAIYSNVMWSKLAVQCGLGRHEFPDVLQGKLELLIEAGVDVHHKNVYGGTPSTNARDYGCWTTWCEALRRTGRPVQDKEGEAE